MTKIDIISGFLGAGKTTLIKKLLKEGFAKEKLVLIENEFGEIGIDGGFLKEAGVQITEMNSGCICCSLVGDFGKALREVLDQFHPDRIIIEPSGVGKLSDVISAVKGVLTEDIVLNSYTAVVDVKKCKMYMKNFGEFFNNQVESAKTIVLSRTQEVTEDKLNAAISLLREHNEKATIVTTAWDEIDGSLIVKAMEGENSLADDLLKEMKKAHAYDDHACDCGCGDACDCGADEDDHACDCGCGDACDCGLDEDDHACDCGCGDACDCGSDEDEDDHACDCGCGDACDCGADENEDDDKCDCGCGCGNGNSECDCLDDDEHDHECDCGHDHDEHEHECDCGHDHAEHEHECGCGHDHNHEHHHAEEVFTSWGTETVRKYSKEELETILNELSEAEDIGFILRAKGIVAGTDGGWHYFDFVPGEFEIRKGAADVTGKLCVIGSKLKTEEIERMFK